MKIRLTQRDLDFAVLIPSKGRPDELMKTLQRQPFLNTRDTFIGIQNNESYDYRKVQSKFREIRWIKYKGSGGCVAREALREVATSIRYRFYVSTDDNARYTEESLHNLVKSALMYPRPCIVSGFHGTAPHFDASKIKKAKEYGGFHFYHKWGAIFWCIPHSVYGHMSYPPDGGRMDDRFVSFAALRQGITDWVVCMEAPYVKPTGKKGGYSAAGRTKMMGQSVVKLAEMYPEYMEKIVISFPWQRIIAKAKEGLRGGRKET